MEVALYFLMLFLAFLVLTIMEIFKEQKAGN